MSEFHTGSRAFDGDSPASVMAAIVERPAPSVGAVAPAALDRIVQKCLSKAPDDRWQSARDLRTALSWSSQVGLPATPGGLPTNIPTGVGVGASGTIYFSSDIENAIYKVVKK